jgi:crossover junction endodeoxyribonuclease RuvC
MERVILGIDPGTTITGYGVITVNSKNPVLLTIGIINLSKMNDHYEKLYRIFERTLSLIEEYKVTELAIESPFFGKNVQSMLKLGRAQGTAIAAALYRQLPVYEYAPRKIKMSITGQGGASKEQVAFILKKILKFEKMPKNLDATDGLAAAVCHFFQNSYSQEKGSVRIKNWKDFISKNPERVK